MKGWKDVQGIVINLYEAIWGWITPLIWPRRQHHGRPVASSLPMEDPRTRKRWPIHTTWLIRLGRPLARLFLPFLADVHLIGIENLPPEGAFVLAGNHLSMLDPILLCALLPRYPYFMSKQELFRHPLLAWFLRQAGAFPVDRSGGDLWAMDHARRILQSGNVLGIFPEGTRSRQDGILGKGKTGAVRLALESNVPIVPVAIVGSDRLSAEYQGPWRPVPVHVHIGTPLYVGQMVTQASPSPEEVQVLTTLLMKRIAEMLPPKKRGVYDG